MSILNLKIEVFLNMNKKLRQTKSAQQIKDE